MDDVRYAMDEDEISHTSQDGKLNLTAFNVSQSAVLPLLEKNSHKISTSTGFATKPMASSEPFNGL